MEEWITVKGVANKYAAEATTRANSYKGRWNWHDKHDKQIYEHLDLVSHVWPITGRQKAVISHVLFWRISRYFGE